MVGDDQAWIKEAGDIAVARFGCRIFSKTLFHIPTGGSHDQSTFNHENFETKCAGKAQPVKTLNPKPCSAMLLFVCLSHREHEEKDIRCLIRCACTHATRMS